MTYRLAPLLLLAVAACAPSASQRVASAAAADKTAADLNRALAGLTPRQPVSCLPTAARTQSTAYGSTIIYTVSRREKYRNDTVGGCESIARGDILVTRSPAGQLCSGDIAQTVDPGSRMQTGGCALREFIPYRR